eukprot:gene11507-biopygen2148
MATGSAYRGCTAKGKGLDMTEEFGQKAALCNIWSESDDSIALRGEREGGTVESLLSPWEEVGRGAHGRRTAEEGEVSPPQRAEQKREGEDDRRCPDAEGAGAHDPVRRAPAPRRLRGRRLARCARTGG